MSGAARSKDVSRWAASSHSRSSAADECTDTLLLYRNQGHIVRSTNVTADCNCPAPAIALIINDSRNRSWLGLKNI